MKSLMPALLDFFGRKSGEGKGPQEARRNLIGTFAIGPDSRPGFLEHIRESALLSDGKNGFAGGQVLIKLGRDLQDVPALKEQEKIRLPKRLLRFGAIDAVPELDASLTE